MASKPHQDTSAKAETPIDPLAQLRDAGFGNMLGMGTAWLERLNEMGAEMVSFVADRIKEDVKTQHEILNCRTANELQHVQAKFVQKAMDQYQAETGKLFKMGAKTMSRNGND